MSRTSEVIKKSRYMPLACLPFSKVQAATASMLEWQSRLRPANEREMGSRVLTPFQMKMSGNGVVAQHML